MTPPSPRPPAPKGYELLQPLGSASGGGLAQGGMGELWLAHQTSLDRQVVVKFLKPEFTAQPQFRERFEREAKILARLEHPRIVRVIDRGVDDGRYFLVMTLVQGRSLHELLSESPPGPDEAMGIVADVAEALDYAHHHGVLHRDVKPGNILVDAQGRASVVDFGIALLAEDGQTHDTSFAGTRTWAAPEQLRDPTRVDHRADQYALAAVFYQMLAGRAPAGPGQDPSRDNTSVAPALGAVVRKALSADPADRYDSVVEFVKAAQKARRLGSVQRRPGQRPSGRSAAWRRSRDPLDAALTMALVLLPLYLVLWFLDGRSQAYTRVPQATDRRGEAPEQPGTNTGGGKVATDTPRPPDTPDTPAPPATGAPMDTAAADQHWRGADQAAADGRWQDAMDLYQLFIERYPADRRYLEAMQRSRLLRDYVEVEQEAEVREELRQYYDVHRLLSDVEARSRDRWQGADPPYVAALRQHRTEVAFLALARFNEEDVPAALAALDQGRWPEAREAVASAVDCGIEDVDRRAQALYEQIEEAEIAASRQEGTGASGVIDLGGEDVTEGADAGPDAATPGVEPQDGRGGQPGWTAEEIQRLLAETRVTLSLKRASLESFAAALEGQAHLPVRVDPAFDRPGLDVTGEWTDTPLEQVLEGVLFRRDLKLLVLPGELRIQDKPKAWTEVKSRHYRIKTDLSPELGREIGRVMDRMFQEYTRRFRFRFEIKEKLDLIVYSRTADFDAYMGQSGYAGVYRRQGNKKELAATAQRGWDPFTGTLFHEGCHQFIDFHIKDPPTWLNEGLACFFGASRFEGEDFQLGLVDEGRLWAVRAAYNSDKNLALREVVNSTYDQFHDKQNEGLMYATSWIIVHFLVRGQDGRHQPILGACINEMARGRRVDFDRIIGDYDALEREVRAWADGLAR